MAPRDHQFVKCHMIFDIKMENFRRKARLVAGGHITTAPAAVTYASVVSRETVCISLTLAALNDLEVKCGDVLNAYITAPVKDKIWNYLGPEHGKDEGKKAIIARALYGLKSSGSAFCAHLVNVWPLWDTSHVWQTLIFGLKPRIRMVLIIIITFCAMLMTSW